MVNTSLESLQKAEKHLLIIDADNEIRNMLKAILRQSGYSVDMAADGQSGLKKLDRVQYDLILCSLDLPQVNGLDFMKYAGKKIKNTTVLMMSVSSTSDDAIKAMKQGAYDIITKPLNAADVRLRIKKAAERDYLQKENVWLREHLHTIEKSYQVDNQESFGAMIAKSKAMQSVFKLAQKVAEYNTTVLISGESGTGKELIARGIHFNGCRAKMPMIPVNCGAIPENLLESELFGHKQGAFTGADKNKRGLFEEANGGTIFLDEIGELPLSLQVKLLRVLQENEIRMVGDSRTKKIDVRVIAATAKDLKAEVKQRTFREDLYYRLNVLPIHLPALRERSDDISLLCQHFIVRFNKKLRKNVKGITPAGMSILLNYNWPGNVRELENVIERAVVLAEDAMLQPENLPPELLVKSEAEKVDEIFEGYSLKSAQKVVEKKLIIKALLQTGGNRTKASRLLEISHPSLLSKIKSYQILM